MGRASAVPFLLPSLADSLPPTLWFPFGRLIAPTLEAFTLSSDVNSTVVSYIKGSISEADAYYWSWGFSECYTFIFDEIPQIVLVREFKLVLGNEQTVVHRRQGIFDKRMILAGA